MTSPAAQKGLCAERLVVPTQVRVEEPWLVWTETHPDPPDDWGLVSLLEDFCELAEADAEEMARFTERYGVAEVRGTEVRDSFVRSQRAGQIPTRQLRHHARALSAGRRVAAALVTRRPGDMGDWVKMQHATGQGWVVSPDDWGDWKLGRERFADWLSVLLEQSETTAMADWLGARRLAVEPVARGLLGIVTLLLAREVGAEGQYECDSCGGRVTRARPPRPGERVYCSRPECKREQQRRNQAAWRAKKSGK